MPLAQGLFAFIASYGYFAVFIGAIFEGETVLILGGLLAEQNHLSLSLIMLSAFLGSTFGDTSWFLLGKYGGTRVLQRLPFLARLTSGPIGLVSRKPRLLSLLMRFMFGFRTIVPFSIGMSKLKTLTFMGWNGLGVLLWVTIFGGVGYGFGAVIETFFGRIRRFELIVIIVIVLAFALFHTITSIAKRQVMRRAARLASEKTPEGAI